jgi:hypothetical protein
LYLAFKNCTVFMMLRSSAVSAPENLAMFLLLSSILRKESLNQRQSFAREPFFISILLNLTLGQDVLAVTRWRVGFFISSIRSCSVLRLHQGYIREHSRNFIDAESELCASLRSSFTSLHYLHLNSKSRTNFMHMVQISH